MPLTLRWKDATALPVEAESLLPEILKGLTPTEIARKQLPHGNTVASVGDLFAITGDLDDSHLIFEGNLRPVRAIGSKMSTGTITVMGNVGPRAGLAMSGGLLNIEGNVGVWAGSEMKGGMLRIRGDAESGLGAALPGSRSGIREGVILLEGSAGDDVGLSMRRGLIAIRGNAGDGLGRGMIAGSIFTFGHVGESAGMMMKRGTIAMFGLDRPDDPPLLPTFFRSGQFRPHFLTIYLKQLVEWGFPIPTAMFAGPLARYNGDLAERGQGEILVWPATG